MNVRNDAGSSRIAASPSLPLNQLYTASNLTLRQLRFWLLQEAQPDLPVERFLRIIMLSDALAEHLEDVWNWFSAAADATRARLLLADGVPLLRFESIGEPLYRATLTEGDDPAEAVLRWAESTDWTVFRTGDLLHRHALVTMADGRKFWSMTSNHLVNDGRGGNVMFRIMASAMEALSRGESLPPLMMKSFEKNMAEERLHEQNSNVSGSEQPWDDNPPPQPVPFSLFGIQHSTLSDERPLGQANVQADLLEKLVAVCQQPGWFLRSIEATLANVFVALAAVWAWRHGGQRELIVGIPFHGRSAEERDMIGFKSEILPVKICIDPEQGFSQLLQEVHKAVRSSLSHRGQSVANPAHAPTYRVIVSFNFELIGAAPMNSQMRRIQVAKRSATPEMLSLEIVNADGDDGAMHVLLRARKEYAGLTEIGWLAEGIHDALEDLVAAPDIPVQTLRFRDPATSQRIGALEAVAVSAVPTDWISRWSSSLSSIGDRAALISGDNTLTHAELAISAGRWAGLMRSRGFRRGDRVVIWSQPSHAVSCAWLALMGTGGVHVPVHHGVAVDSLRELVRNVSARFVLHAPGLLPEDLPEGVICIALDDRELSTHAPALLADPQPLESAHIFHTSGSTGVAKAIEVSHGALTASIRGWIDANRMEEGERIFHFYAITFDPWLTGIMPALWLGGTCVSSDLDRPPSADELVALLREHRISTLCTPTAYFHALCDLVVPEVVSRWIVGGEALAADKAVRFLGARGQSPRVQLVNAYGPTETTIWASIHIVNSTHASAIQSPQTKPHIAPVPIGAPVSTCGFRVADQAGDAVPLGVPGELWICGPQLAMGYVGQADLTANQFVTRDGSRWYRTGDIVRLRKDGRLDYLGRADRQVQVKGYRVEPGEIEIALRDIDGVDDALVVPVTTASTTSLCAYLRLQSDQPALRSEAIRIALLRSLPEYKVPRWVIPVDRFPANNNGKIDVSALPPPHAQDDQVSVDRLPTLTLWDLRFAFEEVLGLPRVRVDDNFFESGGDSLLLVELIAAIERRFGRRLDPADVIRHPTIGGLAPLLESGRASAGNPVVVLQQGSRNPLFCIPGAGGIGVEFYALSRRLPADQPVVVLRPSGTDGRAQPPDSVDALLDEHVERLLGYRAQHGIETPVHLMGYSLGGIFAFEVAKRLQNRGVQIARLYLIDAHVATKEGRALVKQPRPSISKWLRSHFTDTPEDRERKALDAELRAAIAAGRIMDAAQLGRYNLLCQVRLARGIESTAGSMPSTYFLASRGSRRSYAELWRQLLPDLHIEIIEGDHDGDGAIVREPNVAGLGQVTGRLLSQ